MVLLPGLAFSAYQETNFHNFKPRWPKLFYLKMCRALELLVIWLTIAAYVNGLEPTSNSRLPTDYVRKELNFEAITQQQKAHAMQRSWRRATGHCAVSFLIALTAAVTVAYLVLQCFRALNSKLNTGGRRHSEDHEKGFGACGVSSGFFRDR